MFDVLAKGSFRRALIVAAMVSLAFTGVSRAQWVQWSDETATRLSGSAAVTTADLEEKDFAWGDVDQDGDEDLVVVRKEPVTSAGKRVNVLFLNVNGVLTESTALYVVDSSISGDNGFNTPTNDRDVKLVDLNEDGWLDIVTAPTISDGDPKHIGHPRIYINQGEDVGNNWLGFRYEDSLFPDLLTYTNLAGFNPRFCSVAVGDVSGDNRPDLWFGDYDSSGAGGLEQPPGADFNDRLMLNSSSTRFVDATTSRFSGLIQIAGTTDTEFPVTAFGAAGAIADMNVDGFNDIVKQTALNAPQYVGISYNSPDDEGFFDTHEVVNQNAPYFVSVGDLNNDGLPDMVITDDGQDRFLLNQGNGGDGLADFIDSIFTYQGTGDDGFGSNSLIVDLDNDGWNDVLIADVDVDEAGCNRRMHIFHNQGGTPGASVDLKEETSGTGCGSGNPASCLVGGIPADRLTGVHDIAAMDLNGDGWKDLVLGRCSGTDIWINQPPTGVSFSYPSGLVSMVTPGIGSIVQVQIDPIGGTTLVPGSESLWVSVAGGAFASSTMTAQGGGLFEGTLPSATTCLDDLRYYFTVDVSGGGTASDPNNAPASSHSAVSAFGLQTVFSEDVEGDVSAWTISSQNLTAGEWEAAIPEGTLTGGGQQAAPDQDAEPDPAVRAFVTQNGLPGGSSAAADLDGGPTDLVSPVFDLSGTDGIVTYSRWFFNDDNDEDALEVAISTDGTNWVTLQSHSGALNAWESFQFRVSDHVTPNATLQLRFRAFDNPNNSVTEAAVDAIRVEAFVCAECSTNPQCDDGDFCNGAEVCNAGNCEPGGDPCPGQTCDEGSDICVECVVDGDCTNPDFCDGVEICSNNVCVPGSDPCVTGLCDEVSDTCVACLNAGDCDDGNFCNGAESCDGGVCSGPLDPCPGQMCDEDQDICVGNITLQPKMGDPIDGLTGAELARFDAGRLSFNTVLSDVDGLGPVFNQNSCASCHNNPIGGSGSILVTRFGFDDAKGGGFDDLSNLGGSLLQAVAIDEACIETVPVEANVTTLRLTNSILGFGLVEAVDDADLLINATLPPAGVSGKAHMVNPLEAPTETRVGRFGWKSQVATLLSFSGDASLNEMGLTNRLVPTENAPNGSAALLAACDNVADPEDGPDGQGFDFIDRVTDFQRFLAPPPQTPRSGMTGEVVFNTVQCSACHKRSFTTQDDPGLETALRNRVLRPYSDFLVHDMGGNADFIPQGQAEARELRTTPLWGLRVRDPLWHDGRVAGGTFETRVRQAIGMHDSLGSEGNASAQAFDALSVPDQTALIDFLDSLGRAEFDHDGDSDVDLSDHDEFQACFTGPGSFYLPDDPCSRMDVDQDGDVDNDDFILFDIAVDAPAGRVPGVAGGSDTPLTLDRSGGSLTLSWSPSCSSDDVDYAIYEGTLGNFTSHQSVLCTTGGATTETVAEPGASSYYLVVPLNPLREGSYGTDSAGNPRIAGANACAQQTAGACQ